MTALSSGVTWLGISSLVAAGLIGLRLTSPDRSFSPHSSVAALERLSSALIMIQSFEGDPKRTPPRLWNERLGVEPARDLWRRIGRSIWWQAWSQDGEAYLVLSALALPSDLKELYQQRVGPLVVLGSDALHRQQLQRTLAAASSFQPELQPDSPFRSCLTFLDRGTAVYWRSDAVASVSGTLAPLLQLGREGCVRLQLTADRMRWDGVIGQRPLRSASPERSPNGFSADRVVNAPPQSALTLLHVQGARLDLLLGTLLSRQIIQTPLETYYGLNATMRRRLVDRPFALRLQQRDSGSFRAGLQVQLLLKGERKDWQSVLQAVTERLQVTGFEPLPSTNPTVSGEYPRFWRRRGDDDNTLVGGWQWLNVGDSNVLSIGFGIEPSKDAFLAVEPDTPQAKLHVYALPNKLKQIDLLGGGWPKPVARASDLTFTLQPLKVQGTRPTWWRMKGQLRLSTQS